MYYNYDEASGGLKKMVQPEHKITRMLYIQQITNRVEWKGYGKIDIGAFVDLDSLSSISISHGINIIMSEALSNLSKLTKINLNDNNVETVEDNTFVNHPSLN